MVAPNDDGLRENTAYWGDRGNQHIPYMNILSYSLDNNDILLASCAQDNMIRVWRLSVRDQSHDNSQAVRSIADMPLEQDISVKETLFSVVKSGKHLFLLVLLI